MKNRKWLSIILIVLILLNSIVVLAVDEVDEAKVNLVFDPVWEPHMMSEDAKEIMGASGAAMNF